MSTTALLLVLRIVAATLWLREKMTLIQFIAHSVPRSTRIKTLARRHHNRVARSTQRGISDCIAKSVVVCIGAVRDDLGTRELRRARA
jgi:hypothetical protein